MSNAKVNAVKAKPVKKTTKKVSKKVSKEVIKEQPKVMHILHIASECAPFFKTGGLADVIGSVAKKQVEYGQRVSVILPLYRDLAMQYRKELNFVCNFDVYMSWRKQYAGIYQLKLDNVDYYFVDNEYYFGRVGFYGYGDDGERFGFFTIACLEIIAHLQLAVDIVHAHDWHVGMAATLYHEHYEHFDYYKNIHFIFTIHNPAYQGNYDKAILGNIFGLTEATYEKGLTRFKDKVSYIKSAIVYSDFITTVSPTHRQELLSGLHSYDLEGVLQSRQDHFYGILNGVDYQIFGPEHDPNIINFNVDSLDLKLENKRILQKEFSLPATDAPILTFISRLTWQKGVEILISALYKLLDNDIQVVLIGNGDYLYEQEFQKLRDKYPSKVGIFIGFNDKLARKAYAGADFLLMPSLFEPCGINQLIALAYGTIPIVRECGGLKDSVEPYNQYENTGNGFSFTHFDVGDLVNVVLYALSVYHDAAKFKALKIRAMKSDYSWDKSAKEYLEIYKKTGT